MNAKSPVTIYDRFPYPRPATRSGLLHDVSDALSLILRDDQLRDRHVLDVGCGTGHRLVALARQYPRAHFTGVDLSGSALAVGRALANEHRAANVELIQGDLHHMDLGRSFDLVICSGVLHHLPDPGLGLRAVAAQMAPDGLLYAWLYDAIGEYDRMVDRELVHMFAEGDASNPGLELVRALGLRISPSRYGVTESTAELTSAEQDILDADTYLNPIVRPLRFRDLPALFEDVLDWASVVGITYESRGKLLDLGGMRVTPFHLTLADVFTDTRLLASTDGWDNIRKLTAVELRTRPTGFSVLAGCGAAMSECEPWVSGNVIIGHVPASAAQRQRDAPAGYGR
ncbi:MAG: class I SAM-dependent methyltransferase [Actinobacteria bacterium]|nr:class I SAM-dependent methyltransferase [Actinomycetota bacterium]